MFHVVRKPGTNAVLIFLLAAVSLVPYLFLILYEPNSKSNLLEQNHQGLRMQTRNPPTSGASPLCTSEQRNKIAHQLMLKDDEDIRHTDRSSLSSPRLAQLFKCPKTSWIDKYF